MIKKPNSSVTLVYVLTIPLHWLRHMPLFSMLQCHCLLIPFNSDISYEFSSEEISLFFKQGPFIYKIGT